METYIKIHKLYLHIGFMSVAVSRDVFDLFRIDTNWFSFGWYIPHSARVEGNYKPLFYRRWQKRWLNTGI